MVLKIVVLYYRCSEINYPCRFAAGFPMKQGIFGPFAIAIAIALVIYSRPYDLRSVDFLVRPGPFGCFVQETRITTGK